MTPNALLLRKFRGIKDGMGLDELLLDFSSLPDGTIVLVGENGKGKTTILDNMQPHRIMPSKVKKYSTDAFNYYDECYGDDACKELYWTGDDGQKYRTLININADKRKQEAYLYRIDENGKQNPLNPDGKTGSYDAALEAILCKPELYFISDFRAQNAKYVSDYSNGDIKEILAEFLGIEYIRALSRNARFLFTELGKVLKGVFEEKQGLLDRLSHKDAREAELKTLQHKVSVLEKTLEAKEKGRAHLEDALTEIRSTEALQANLVLQKQELADEITRKEGIITKITAEGNKRIEAIVGKVRAISDKIVQAKALAASAYTKTVKVAELRANETKKAGLQNTVSRAENELTEVHNKLKELAQTERVLRQKETAMSQYSHKADLEIARMRGEQDSMQKEAGKLRDVPCKDTALASACEFVKDAVEASKQLPGKMEELQQFIQRSEEERRRLRNEALPLSEDCKDKAALEAKETRISRELAAARKGLTECDTALTEARRLEIEIAGSVAAQKTLPELEQQHAELETEKAAEEIRISKDMDTLQQEIRQAAERRNAIIIDEGIGLRKKETEDKISVLKENINTIRAEEKALARNVGALEVEVSAYPLLQEQLAAVDKRAKYLGSEVAEWTIMAKALGDEGIIALEIDDAGPAISKLANDLLREVYGNRLTIRIDTQDTTGKKLKEDFDITVIDGRSNKTKSIKKVSGGEKELLEDLIPKAVSLFNKERTGRGSSTLFTDERDGALDAARKRAFFLMKTRVQALGNYRQEFCITHTPELVKMANGVIELKDGMVSMYSNQ